MKLISLFFVLILSWHFNPNVDKGDDPIRFQLKNAGVTVNGTISDLEYEIYWDAKELAKCKITGTANPATIKTGIKLRDKHLVGKQYFHTDKFPLISLQSKKISPKGKNRYVGVFDLQIRDVKKEIEVPFTVLVAGQLTVFKAEFSLNRLDFGVGESSLVLSDEVKVMIELKK
jgi:polyisoprenoid-binding protein YceI